MLANWRVLLTMLLILICALMASLASHYHSKAAAAAATASRQQQTIISMQQQQNDVAAIDAKYTRELNDAKQNINDLQRDVSSGAKRLRINATCKRMPDPTAASGMANDASARPADTAERDYFTLRERIATAEKQIAGLQEYIRLISNK